MKCSIHICSVLDYWYTESKHVLQPPKYRFIIVDRFNYIKINFTELDG